MSKKEDFYKVKSKIEKKIDNFYYSGIEWRPRNYINLSKEQNDQVIKMLETLDKEDDVQNTFVNCAINFN